VACVIVPGTGRQPHKEIRTFGAMTADLLESLIGSVSARSCTSLMESTGVYWKPIVRHEALFDCEGMKGSFLCSVALKRGLFRKSGEAGPSGSQRIARG